MEFGNRYKGFCLEVRDECEVVSLVCMLGRRGFVWEKK